MKRRALYSLAVLVLVAGVAEGTARAIGGKFLPSRRSLDAMPGEAVPSEPNMVVDTVTGWRAKTGQQNSFGIPGGTVVNSQGLRGPELPLAKPAGERRVLLVGDSTVFGVLVADRDIFARRLETALQRVDPNVKVLNGAAPGWSSWQARRALEERLLAYQPDLLVIATLWSDSQGAGKPDSERFAELLPILDQSRAFLWMREWVRELRYGPEVEEVRVGLTAPGGGAAGSKAPGGSQGGAQGSGPQGPPPPGMASGGAQGSGPQGPPPPGMEGPPGADGKGPGGSAGDGRPPIFGEGGAPTLRVPLDDYRANLETMAAEVAAVGGRTAFLVLPCVRDPAGGKVGDFRDDYRLAMRQTAEKLGAPIAETPEAFVGTNASQMFFDEVHPTAAGHAIVADVLARALDGWVREGAPAGAARAPARPEGPANPGGAAAAGPQGPANPGGAATPAAPR